MGGVCINGSYMQQSVDKSICLEKWQCYPLLLFKCWPSSNIASSSIDEIWHGKKLNQIRANLRKGNYEKAGCEYYCRPYRWSKLYGDKDHPIPEGGLGRISEVNYEEVPMWPRIFAMEFDGHCNMTCAHCLGSHYQTKGLPDNQVRSLEQFVDEASIIRIMGGEFSVNPRNLKYIESVAAKVNQPTVFLNTNGKRPISSYVGSIDHLESLHMKFSLEGMNEDYEKVRTGLSWTDFVTNLDMAMIYLRKKTRRR